MLQGGIIVFLSLAYIGLLFGIAHYGDQRAEQGRSLINNPYIYALSLGVYCTAWTFYGSVGRAATAGVFFLPIYLGPTLMAVLWWLILRKMIRISKVNRITSIADFIASRYGKSTTLAGLVTIIAVLGTIPYISLQLKAISTSFTVIATRASGVNPVLPDTGLAGDTALYVTLLLAAFAILFGTRHLDATEHHEGLVVAIAFESVVKLVAFLIVGFYVTIWQYGGFVPLFQQATATLDTTPLFTMQNNYADWGGLVFVSMMAIMFLPRQFHMAVVENTNENHVNKAIWLFPLYLLLINIFVLPIALAGLLEYPNELVDPDMFVLIIPIDHGEELLAIIAFIGGLSAATSMVIVATVALTTMISNDLLMPLLLRWQIMRPTANHNLGWWLLFIRRSSIILILLLSYIYFRYISSPTPLVSIGLISFAAVAQFAPAILGGMYWRDGNEAGALTGLSAGFLVWGYTLLLPTLVESGLLPTTLMTDGLFGINLLRPHALLGLTGLEPISHSLVWSMAANIGGYLFVSLLTQQSVIEFRQANLFVDIYKHSTDTDTGIIWRGSASVEALRTLLTRFLGAERTEEAFTTYASQRGFDWSHKPEADAQLIDFAEKQLAGATGSASARVMVASVVREEPLSPEAVLNILDETSQLIAYSHQLEQKSQELEAATTELRAANDRLQELDRLKDDFISTVTHELRTPLTSIRAFSEILSDNPDLHVAQRLQFSGIIMRESERLTRLINQVLDLSKIESGKMEWHLHEFSLKEVVNDALLSTEQLFIEHNIKLELDVPETVPLVTADRDRIVQVLLNLLSNAIKFCDPTAGRIRVRLLIHPDTLQVDVSDNGRGIAPKDQAVIFEKFRQVGDTLTEKPQGTGLGLPICQQIISHFGGDLWVESTLGEGSTFSFTLPRS